MTDRLETIARAVDPRRTTLLLGAGAAYSSGAPLGTELCRYLETKLGDGQRISDDLTELASILEHRTSRRALAEAIVQRLASLEPDGGLIALTHYPWLSIYTTNYDRLVEKAYASRKVPLAVVRSHFDWEVAHEPGVTPLFKLHGCISEDRALGHRASMIVTSEDYTNFEQYRKLLFDRLRMEMAGNATWVIGYSLRDPHVRLLVNEVLRLQREAATPGRLYLLVHEFDAERAQVWRGLGVRGVFQGDLNAFAHAIAQSHDDDTTPVTVSFSGAVNLPPQLSACTMDVQRSTQPSNPKRLFYGGAASYADIDAGLTFARDVESQLRPANTLATVVTGVAGTGKTTLARRLVAHLVGDGWLGFEHRSEFQLQPEAWSAIERQLRESQCRAALLVDNCPPFQRQVNALVRGLPVESALHVIVTAETSAWKPRQKDSRLFSHARHAQLSSLSAGEIRELRNLVTRVSALRELLQPEFLRQAPLTQEETLRRKCAADMFVCLKAIFSSDTLDDIILREYGAIDPAFQEPYRITAALEAAGALPHRQMVLRVSRLPASLVSGALDVLEGVIDEQEPSSAAGIFLWRTRHEVIARLITRYKFSDLSELKALLEETIATANPSYYEEVRTLREICNSTMGIRALPDPSDRANLYRRIVDILPADRVARHRLVRELIESERYGDAEAELKSAVDDVGLDPPLLRYGVKLLILRSRGPGILDGDRRAILKAALADAERGMASFRDSKYMYFAAADVGEEWYELTRERGLLEWAKQLLETAYKNLLDPDLMDRANRLARR